MSFFNLQNPQTIALKKYLYGILKDKYHKHDDLISRIGPVLITESDFNGFTKFCIELCEVGFLSAVEQHKEVLEKSGLKATIKTSNEEENKIFK